jgi:hypothetical protein
MVDAIVYGSKRLEYREFCESLYPNPSQLEYMVDDHKMLYFILFAAMVEGTKTERGGNNRVEEKCHDVQHCHTSSTMWIMMLCWQGMLSSGKLTPPTSYLIQPILLEFRPWYSSTKLLLSVNEERSTKST